MRMRGDGEAGTPVDPTRARQSEFTLPAVPCSLLPSTQPRCAWRKTETCRGSSSRRHRRKYRGSGAVGGRTSSECGRQVIHHSTILTLCRLRATSRTRWHVRRTWCICPEEITTTCCWVFRFGVALFVCMEAIRLLDQTNRKEQQLGNLTLPLRERIIHEREVGNEGNSGPLGLVHDGLAMGTPLLHSYKWEKVSNEYLPWYRPIPLCPTPPKYRFGWIT